METKREVFYSASVSVRGPGMYGLIRSLVQPKKLTELLYTVG